MLKRIGLTGPVGSGKSEVSKYLGSKGFIVIDADRIGHKLLEDNLIVESLCSAFGNCIIDMDNKIDRMILGQIAFSTRENLEVLDDVVGRRLQEELEKRIFDRIYDRHLVLEAALLFDWELSIRLDYIILIYADEGIRRQRLKKRGWDDDRIERLIRLNKGLPKEEDASTIGSTVISSKLIYKIENNSSLEELYKGIDNILLDIGT